MKRLLQVVAFPALIAAAAISAPVRYDPRSGLREATACGQIDQTPVAGTCCRQLGSLCIIGTFREENRYYKAEGACP